MLTTTQSGVLQEITSTFVLGEKFAKGEIKYNKFNVRYTTLNVLIDKGYIQHHVYSNGVLYSRIK